LVAVTCDKQETPTLRASCWQVILSNKFTTYEEPTFYRLLFSTIAELSIHLRSGLR